MEQINNAVPPELNLTDQFDYTEAQMDQLQLASEISTILSLIAIILIIAVYCYMLFYHPRDANRVSLHCVIGANVVSLIDHCMALKLGSVTLDSAYCKNFRVLDGLFTIMTCCLLGMVGVHLFLVLVCHINWPCRPEYILITFAVAFTFIANVFSFFAEELPTEFQTIIHANDRECWFYNAFLDRSFNRVSWIYYYSFMFFIIVVSTVSSAAAMWKVYLDKIKNEQVMEEIAARAVGENPRAVFSYSNPDPIHATRHQQSSNVFTKVVGRSLLYPLMPALTYVTGFVIQMYIVNPYHSVQFAFALVGNVMTRLGGVFTAFIFFIDPTVLTIPHEIWMKCTGKRRIHHTTDSIDLDQSHQFPT